jgi:hypothetical protein
MRRDYVASTLPQCAISGSAGSSNRDARSKAVAADSTADALARVRTRERRGVRLTPLAGHFSGRVLRDTSHSAASRSGHDPGRTPARYSRGGARQSVRQVAGPEDRRLQGDEARRGIVEDVALEATPVALVGSEVAASPAARSVGLEGMELRPSPRGDLQHLAAIEVASVDDEGDAWVALEQLSEP